MKVICSWCQKLIRYKCPSCGETLVPSTIPTWGKTYMMCPSEPTVIHFSIARMQTTHGICEECRAKQNAPATERRAHRQLSDEDKANLSALDGAGNRGEPAKKGKNK